MGLMQEIKKFEKGGASRVEDFRRYIEKADVDEIRYINAELAQNSWFGPAVLYEAASVLDSDLFIALVERADQEAIQKSMRVRPKWLNFEGVFHMVARKHSSLAMQKLLKKVG